MEVKQSLAFVLILLNLVCQAKADCDAPTGFRNAKLLSDLSDQQAVFEEKHELLYECNIGFRPATGRGSRCWNGRWTEIRCERIFCKWLPAPDNGRRLDSNAYVGEYTTFACNEGYQLIGYKTLLCRADGKWRPSDPPVCKPVSCGRLPWLANGEAFQATRDGNLNLYGSVVKLSCKFGFDLIKGSKERRCQADGTWSGTQPVCEEPTCPKLEPFYNGVIYYQNDDVISLYHVAEIECNDGSDVFPEGTRFVTCVEGNTWDVNNITCERHLTISPPSHMKLYTGQGRYRSRITSSRRLKSRTSLHVECEYKHELVDGKTNKYYEVNSLQVRIFNGTVVPELPICRKERCNLVADHGSFMDTDWNKLVGKVEHNTVVVKMCDPDFEFEPSYKRKEPSQRSTCNQGGISFPRCIPKQLLEKMIRMEVKVETMFDSITRTQHDIAELTTRVNKELNLLTKEREQIKDDINVYKADTRDKLLEGARNMKTTLDDFESKITRYSEDFVGFKRNNSALAKDQSVSYIRWGRSTCPKTSTIVYEGVAAGSHYTNSGGASNTICLPQDPQFGNTYPGQQSSYIYSAEYEEAARTQSIYGQSIHNQDVPCVVCEVKGSAMMMIPARQECYDEWQFEYTGYLMTEHHTHYRSDIKCVDSQPESVPGKGSNSNGDLFYFVEATGALSDPPYTKGAELTCVVCTK